MINRIKGTVHLIILGRDSTTKNMNEMELSKLSPELVRSN
jgi:hypothetical protein